MKNYLPLLICLFLFSACADKIMLPNLNGGKWKLAEWPGRTLPATAKATLEFKAGNNVSGKSFCNGYGGSYVLNGNQINFGPLFGTKMYCEEVGDAETAFLNAMDLANLVQVKDGKLYLMQDEKPLLIFTKTE